MGIRDTLDAFNKSGNAGTHPPIQEAPGKTVRVVLSNDEYKDQAFKLGLQIHQTLKRLTEMAYNYKNPVDEYQVIGAGGVSVTIQPDYDQLEMYEAIAYSLPLGTTTATLSFGNSSDRVIQLYSGAALTVQQPQVLPYLRILAGPNDKRVLTLTGATTTQGYIGLMGHCFERDGGGR